MKYILAVIFLLGLWYLIIPIPLYKMFSVPPESVLSNQSTNITAYYSNKNRSVTTGYYQSEIQKLQCSSFKILNPFCLIKPLKLNHPPELATTFIQPKQQSTYLEEYYYPFRESLFVNGYEPFDQMGKPFNIYSQPLIYNGKKYNAQITVLYTPSSVISRMFVYLLIWLSISFGTKVFKNNKIFTRNNQLTINK